MCVLAEYTKPAYNVRQKPSMEENSNEESRRTQREHPAPRRRNCPGEVGGGGGGPVHLPAGVLGRGESDRGRSTLDPAPHPAGGLSEGGGRAHSGDAALHARISRRRHADRGRNRRLHPCGAQHRSWRAAGADGLSGSGAVRLRRRFAEPDSRHRGHGDRARAAAGEDSPGRGAGAAPRADAGGRCELPVDRAAVRDARFAGARLRFRSDAGRWASAGMEGRGRRCPSGGGSAGCAVRKLRRADAGRGRRQPLAGCGAGLLAGASRTAARERARQPSRALCAGGDREPAQSGDSVRAHPPGRYRRGCRGADRRMLCPHARGMRCGRECAHPRDEGPGGVLEPRQPSAARTSGVAGQVPRRSSRGRNRLHPRR